MVQHLVAPTVDAHKHALWHFARGAMVRQYQSGRGATAGLAPASVHRLHSRGAAVVRRRLFDTQGIAVQEGWRSAVGCERKITSHRARATIASQPYNAKEPLTLFELQEWLGHVSPESTRHYAKITLTKLAKSFTDAGYFARNVRAIEILIDRSVVQDWLAKSEPWRYFDLRHGLCSYVFLNNALTAWHALDVISI